MMLTLWYNKFVPAAVLSALAGTNHMIEDNRPMAETIIAPVLIQAKVAQYLNTRRYLDRYACRMCGECFVTLQSNAKRKVTCNACSSLVNGLKHSTHGHFRGGKQTALHAVWDSMIARCYRASSQSYPHYGGRGITVCSEWMRFEGFMQWDRFGDWKKGVQLDRIDNSKGYSPDNCRWATPAQNCQNKRSTVLSADLVRLIRIYHGSGVPQRWIAKMMNVSPACINVVVKFKQWGNI